MPTKTKPLIRISNLSKVYPFGETEIRAIDNISLEIAEGDFVSIMGPSGSGKSTLLQLLGALDTPTEGEYFLDDVAVNKSANLAEIRRDKIGFVFQTFNLLPTMTAIENVALPMTYAGKGRNERIKHAETLLRKVGLGSRFDHRPNQLSGGQRQRVAIARALANDPKIVLADEPTGNLDSKSGTDVMKILKELNKKGTTLILVTHEEYIAKQAHRIIKVRDGKISKK